MANATSSPTPYGAQSIFLVRHIQERVSLPRPLHMPASVNQDGAALIARVSEKGYWRGAGGGVWFSDGEKKKEN